MIKCIALLVVLGVFMVSLKGINAQVKRYPELIQMILDKDCVEVDLNIGEPRFCVAKSGRMVMPEFGD